MVNDYSIIVIMIFIFVKIPTREIVIHGGLITKKHDRKGGFHGKSVGSKRFARVL